MAKQSQIEKAIENINQQIEVLMLARQHLFNQQQAKPKATKRTKPVRVEEKAG